MLSRMAVFMSTAASVDFASGAAIRRFDEIAQSRDHGFPFLFGLGLPGRGGRDKVFG